MMHLEDELTRIVRAIETVPSGAALSQIVAQLQPPLPEYTVQRRLARLIEQKRIKREGTRRGARYFAQITQSSLTASDPIPLSKEAQALRAQMRLPLTARKPVGYQHEFLNRYRPNNSFYLSKTLRDRLRELGTSAIDDRPAGTYARQIVQRLLIDLSWNSSRLEGNTYSLLETEKLLEIGKSADGKDAREAQMLLNHKEAIEFLVDGASEIAFNRYTILNLHALLAKNLLGNSAAEGRLRSINVGVYGTVYMPLEVPQLIDEYFTQVLDTAQSIQDPFEQAFFAMVHIPYLQPFEDVNKRVSRLAANIPFIKKNLCPLSFVELPERPYLDGTLAVYERNDIALLRDVFAWAYERSAARYIAVRHTLGDPDLFRLKYRNEIFDTVAAVVRDGLAKSGATKIVQRRAIADIPEDERARFVEVVETELLNLHIGNIARYRIRPAEFEQWQKLWTTR
jgi:Fic/DOC family